jgi:hypothetical protein
MVRTPKRAATFAAPAPGARAFRERRRHARLPVLQPLTGERPAHRAVLERDHRVRDPGVDERLRPDDAARAPGAVDDDVCRIALLQFFRPQNQVAARDVDAAGDAKPAVLLRSANIENNQIGRTILQRLELFRGQIRNISLIMNSLAKGFAWHIDAAHCRPSFSLPRA